MSEHSKVAYTTTILQPRPKVYEFWRNWENLATFSRHLKSVTDLGRGVTSWVAEGPFGNVSWEAETTEDVVGERISWRSCGDSEVKHHGSVLFKDAPGERGTEVIVRIEYILPAGILGEAVAKITGTSPEAEIVESLRRIKTTLECGELPVVEGQPSNRRRGENVPGEESQNAGLR